MADRSKIEWTDATWNPVLGCSPISPGCTICYAMRLAGTRLKNHRSRVGLTRPSKAGPVWNGKVRFYAEALLQPLRWRRPRHVFVVAHGDLFHEAVPDDWIDQVFAVMALAPQHTFQVLTKRAERMRAYLQPFDQRRADSLGTRVIELGYHGPLECLRWPLPNVWLGVSVEDQARADERIPLLLDTPAALRFLSAEPLLGPIDLTALHATFGVDRLDDDDWRFDALSGEHWFQDDLGYRQSGDGPDLGTLDWIIAGGESGDGSRPMHPAWARSLRDQCAAAGVPFFFKQWGDWVDWQQFGATRWKNTTPQHPSYKGPCFGTFHGGEQHFSGPFETRHEASCIFARKGKREAGRLLDGVLHDGMPAP